jgi:hypothetical protein
MDYFAGLDVSVKETSVCIVDDAGPSLNGCVGRPTMDFPCSSVG